MILGLILFDVIPTCLISAVLYLIIVRFSKRKNLPFTQHFIRYVFLAYVLTVLSLTIFWGGITSENSYHHMNLEPFQWITQTYDMGFFEMIVQVIGNILMFVPYGFLLPLLFCKTRTFWKTFIIVFFSSFMIEFVQYFIGRSCDIDDLIMNTLGGCIGYGVYCVIKHFRSDS